MTDVPLNHGAGVRKKSPSFWFISGIEVFFHLRSSVLQIDSNFVFKIFCNYFTNFNKKYFLMCYVKPFTFTCVAQLINGFVGSWNKHSLPSWFT